jgi:hypothetical protein
VVIVRRATRMENHDFTTDEVAEFGDIFAEIN